MNDAILFGLAMAGLLGLIISLEWDRLKKADLKKVAIVLIILFFLGSALSYVFT